MNSVNKCFDFKFVIAFNPQCPIKFEIMIKQYLIFRRPILVDYHMKKMTNAGRKPLDCWCTYFIVKY